MAVLTAKPFGFGRLRFRALLTGLTWVSAILATEAAATGLVALASLLPSSLLLISRDTCVVELERLCRRLVERMHPMPANSTALRRPRRVTPIPDLDALPPIAFCTTDQVARLIGYSAVTVKLWRAQGKGPRVTVVAGRPRYMVRDLREWMGLQHVSA